MMSSISVANLICDAVPLIPSCFLNLGTFNDYWYSLLVFSNYFAILCSLPKLSYNCYRPQTKFGARYYFHKHVSRIMFTVGVCAWSQGGAWSWGRGCLVLGGGVIPACLAGFQGHTQRESLGRSGGGVSRPTPKGEIVRDLVQVHTQGGS